MFNNSLELMFYSNFSKVLEKIKEIEERYSNSSTFSNLYMPNYTNHFISMNNQSSVFNKMHSQYTITISMIKNKYDELKKITSFDNNDINSLLALEENINKEFFYLGDVLHHELCYYALNFADVQKKISDKIFIIYTIFFTLFIIVSIGISSILSCLLWFKMNSLRPQIQFLWNICFLLLLVAPIIICISGILGTISEQLPPVLSYLLGYKFLVEGSSYYGGIENTPYFVDICINGNGDLSNKIGINNEQTNKLYQYLEISKEIENFISFNFSGISELIHFVSDVELINEDSTEEVNSGITISEMKNQLKKINNDCNKLPKYCTFIEEVANDLKSLKLIAKELLSSLNYTQNILKQIIQNNNYYNSIILKDFREIMRNKQDFKQFFDCSFVNRYLLSFSYQFAGKFREANDSIFFSSLLGLISGCFGVFLLILTINKHSNKGEGYMNVGKVI